MVAAVFAAVLAVALPSQALVDDAAASLRRDPVYVDPTAERALSEAEADDLRSRIGAAGEPVFVAVLPAAAGDAEGVLRELVRATSRRGTYAVVVGDSFRGTDRAAADAAFAAAMAGGTAAVLSAFVDEVARRPAGAGAGGSGPGASPGGGDDDGGGGPSWLPVAVVAGGGAAVYAAAKRRGHRERTDTAAEFDADVQLIRAELSVLSEDVLRHEPEVAVKPEARADYDAAVSRYRAATAALDYADDRVDLVRVERVVGEARYAMARARAILGGYEPPAPPTDLRRPGRHDEPPLELDERGEPVYAGGRTFYGGGWYGGGGGLFGGLLLGSMLGGWGWGNTVIVRDDGGGGFDGGFDGGLGGGDFGDFGDFGGGDF